MIKFFQIMCEGVPVHALELDFDDYKDQPARDAVKMRYAKDKGISPRGLRLVENTKPYIFWTDMATGKTMRKYTDGDIVEVEK